MGQKVHPRGFRIGVTEPWRSKWYAGKHEFGDLLVEDQKIRRFINKKHKYAGIGKIIIERTRDSVVVNIHTARPGIIIGRKGQEIDTLKGDLEELTRRRMDVKIVEINNGFRDAQCISEEIAQQLEKRGSYRRAVKRTLEQVMETGVAGCRIELSGRLGGAEMRRKEKATRGSVPLSTLRRNVNYGFTVARTAQGVIGVKVWVDQGDYEEGNTDGADAQAGQASKGAKRSYKR